jgi:rsbT antagonist protein RsbS
MIDRSLSVIKVGHVLMVTMPADPDDATVAALQQEVLGAMEKHRPQGLVLDISAVETLDSFFARTVAETSRMVALMGGRTVIAGMRPSVAITATQLGLGLKLGSTLAALNVERAFAMVSRSGPPRGRP